MGKGDRRSRRGKIFRGTFGKTRPHKIKKSAPVAKKEVTKAAPKKKAAKKKKAE